jgi:hypothetical protein
MHGAMPAVKLSTAPERQKSSNDRLSMSSRSAQLAQPDPAHLHSIILDDLSYGHDETTTSCSPSQSVRLVFPRSLIDLRFRCRASGGGSARLRTCCSFAHFAVCIYRLFITFLNSHSFLCATAWRLLFLWVCFPFASHVRA